MVVLVYPNPILDQKAEPVQRGERCRETIDAMFAAMDYPRGIGLAAPQIGISKRIICISVPRVRDGKIVGAPTRAAIINPEIVWARGSAVVEPEGCLSFPGGAVPVPRWPRIRVTGFNLRWEPVSYNFKDLAARVVQHEIDHLNGITLHTHMLRMQTQAEKQSDD